MKNSKGANNNNNNNAYFPVCFLLFDKKLWPYINILVVLFLSAQACACACVYNCVCVCLCVSVCEKCVWKVCVKSGNDSLHRKIKSYKGFTMEKNSTFVFCSRSLCDFICLPRKGFLRPFTLFLSFSFPSLISCTFLLLPKWNVGHPADTCAPKEIINRKYLCHKIEVVV